MSKSGFWGSPGGEIVDPNDSEDVMDSLKNIFEDYNNYSIRSKLYAKANKWDRKIDQYEKFLK